jgi:hypothetical protein
MIYLEFVFRNTIKLGHVRVSIITYLLVLLTDELVWPSTAQ